MPNETIHLYCDRQPDTDIFDEFHEISAANKRPKFEALRRASFDRTIYLDADTIIKADVSDVFFVLDQFDIALAQVFYRNTRHCRRTHQTVFPNSFPQYNSGVIGIRRSDRTLSFLSSVEREMADHNAPVDQPIFRELLFYSDLRIATLPPEYNFKQIGVAATLGDKDTAPRIVHESNLHRTYDNSSKSFKGLEALYGRRLSRHLDRLIQADKFLTPGTDKKLKPLGAVRRPKKSIHNKKNVGHPIWAISKVFASKR